MRRRVRIVTSYLCLAMCLALSVVWIHSQYVYSQVVVSSPGNSSWMVESVVGATLVNYTETMSDRSEPLRVLITKVIGDDRDREQMDLVHLKEHYPTVLGFHFSRKYDSVILLIPLGIPAIVLGAMAVALRPCPRRRFGLRDLFLLLTISALVFGTFAALPQFLEHIDATRYN